MEKFWKWLLKTDARGLFVFSLVLLAAVATWCVIDIVNAEKHRDDPVAEVESSPPKLSDYKPLGVMDFISDQFAPDTLVVPINPFHPTFEEIVKTLVAHSESGTIELVVNGVPTKLHFEGSKLVDKDGNVVAEPFQKNMAAPVPAKKPPAAVVPAASNGKVVVKDDGEPDVFAPPKRPSANPPNKPRVSFSGMMQRPNGHYAAYIYDSKKKKGRFVAVGDRVRNSTVVESGRDGVSLKTDDGEVVKLVVGGKPVVLEDTEDE